MVRGPRGSSSAIKVNGMRQAINTLQTLKEGFSSNSGWIVGVGAHYGAYVEFGTSKMAAQPYLFPAARHVMRTEFAQIQAEAMNKSNPVEYIVESTASAIEAEATRRAPVGKTGNLQGSIEAYPAEVVG